MRNLIKFAIQFAVVLTENDVLELGYDPTEAEFKEYLEIPAETPEDYKHSEDFAVSKLQPFMNAEEAATVEGDVEKTEPATTEPTEDKKETAAEKKKREAAEKKAQKEADKKAKAEAKEKEKAEKDAKAKEPKKPGVIASILEIIQKADKPVSEAEILTGLVERFPEKEAASMHKTIKAQLGGKAQPLRMEDEKKVKFVLSYTTPAEGEKAQRLYAIDK